MRKETVSNYAVVPYLNDEERQEAERVRIVRPYCLPERWFVPKPVVTYRTLRGRKRSYGLRRNQCFPLRGRPGRKPRIIPVRATLPGEPDKGQLTTHIEEFVHLSPHHAFQLFTTARSEARFTIALWLQYVLERLAKTGALSEGERAAIRNDFSAVRRQVNVNEDIVERRRWITIASAIARAA